MSVRVLVVDDSAVMRALIKRQLSGDPQIEVVGTATNAAEARQMIKALDPDVVTLDIEMPGMDGLSFLEKIMELRPTPVIIVSGSTAPGAEATARAMRLGAVSCYAKSTEDRSINQDDKGELVRLVHAAAAVNFDELRKSEKAGWSSRKPAKPAIASPDLIVVGSSTGGVEALHTLLSGFPSDCAPTLVVQHVSGCFAGAIATSLDRNVPPRVSLAAPGTRLETGQVVIAPGDHAHLELAGRNGQYRIALREGPAVSGHRPSVDRLFASVAQRAGSRAIGILLTGMGRDGAEGLLAMAKSGALTIAQDEASCTVFGMPRAAIQLGAAQSILPLSQIAPRLFGKVPA